eukprot:jgi/Chlat1/3698/Chrsp249S00800
MQLELSVAGDEWCKPLTVGAATPSAPPAGCAAQKLALAANTTRLSKSSILVTLRGVCRYEWLDN